MTNTKPQIPAPVIFIAGPTASGKSALALDLARQLHGEIINADAIQVYRDLRILSARPTEEEMAGIPHHLYGHVDGTERYSAGAWARAAASIIDKVTGQGRAAIIVGGTGLYFQALEQGLSPMPDVPPALMRAAMERRESLGALEFYNEVVARDPIMARIDPNDSQRQLRAWSIFEATGTRLSDFQNQPREPMLAQTVSARLVLAPPRDQLYANCEKRFDRMVKNGAIAEAAALRGRHLSQTLPVMRALGLSELIRHLIGRHTFNEAVEQAKLNTRRFAKRQLTWFRNQASDWPVAEDVSVGRQMILDRVFQG